MKTENFFPNEFLQVTYCSVITLVCLFMVILIVYLIKGNLSMTTQKEGLEEESQRLLTALENANDKVFGLDAEIETKSLKIAKDLETIEAMKVVLNTQNKIIANHKIEIDGNV